MSDTSTTKLRTLATELREVQAALTDHEEQVKRDKERIRVITTSEMVDVMNTLGANEYGIDREGNLPALHFELGHHYGASIPQSWEDARREAAFNELPEELIKITVKCLFAKGEAQVAQDLAEELITAGYTVQLEKGVHASTLKAWVREQFENGGQLPDLETIGATIFQEVKIKEV